ncbi:MAG: STN domain-containing protein [Pseudacidovorax sp.]|nr:STN domain-containing protein [Pseudacidovorax sp.]
MPVRLGVLLAGLIAAGALHAQPQALSTAIIDLPEQTLGASLATLARQTGQRIDFPADTASALRAPAVHGKLPIDQALARLLAGSGWQAHARADGGWEVRPAPAAANEILTGGAPTLGAITVTATSVSGAPPVYAGGQVAKGARLGILGNTAIMDAPFSITGPFAAHVDVAVVGIACEAVAPRL